jgi:hypothetical protein
MHLVSPGVGQSLSAGLTQQPLFCRAWQTFGRDVSPSRREKGVEIRMGAGVRSDGLTLLLATVTLALSRTWG